MEREGRREGTTRELKERFVEVNINYSSQVVEVMMNQLIQDPKNVAPMWTPLNSLEGSQKLIWISEVLI